jgi:CHAD domain-containing protein
MTGPADEELSPPAGPRVPAAVGLLGQSLAAEGLTLEQAEPGEETRMYLDTFDGRLAAAGLEAAHRHEAGDPGPGRLVVAERDGGAERAGQALPRPGGPLLAVELPAGPLRDALLPIVDVRALLVVAELHMLTSAYSVHDELGKTVARLQVEQPSLGTVELPARVRLSALRGYGEDTARVSRTARRGGFTVPRRTLAEEAVLAAGGAPGGTSSKVSVELVSAQRSDAAAAAVLRRLMEVIEANLDGAIEDLDAEFLHDLRVAVRRSRSVQRELKAVFPPRELERFRGEFRWLQGVTGPPRDLDVHVLGFDELRELVPERLRADLDPVLRVLRDRRRLARRAVVRDLRSERASTLLRDWDAFLEELVAAPLEDRPAAERPISELAGERIAKVYRRIVKLGRAIDEHSLAEDYHELRKKGKELRYLLELFGSSLFEPRAVKPMIKSLKSLQDVLGRHQDREVQQATLRELAEQLATLPERAAALMATGVLLERLREDELAARGEFAERFAAFSAKSLRKRVKETFR